MNSQTQMYIEAKENLAPRKVKHAGRKFEIEMPKKHVLVIEGDKFRQKHWEFLLRSTLPGVAIDWAKDCATAELKLLEQRGDCYDLVIAELENPGAVELWTRFQTAAKNFILIAGSELSSLQISTLLDWGFPVFLQRPMTIQAARQVLISLCELNLGMNHH